MTASWKWYLLYGVFTLCLIGALIGVVLWFVMGSLEESVPGVGQLIPETKLRRVSAPIDGLVVSVDVHENQPVKAGQMLATLQVSAAEIEADTQTQEIGLLEKEMSALESAYGWQKNKPGSLGPVQDAWLSATKQASDAKLRRSKLAIQEAVHRLQESQAKLKQAKSTLASSESLLLQFKTVFEQGALPERDYRTFEQKVIEQRGNVSALEEDVQSRQFALEQAKATPEQIQNEFRQSVLDRLSQHQHTLAQLRNTQAKAQLALDRQVIVSPVDGVVLEQSIRGMGDVVQSGQALFVVVPDNSPLIAEIKINNHDLAYIHKGQRVTLRLDAFPYQQWGKLYGRILDISPSTHTPDNPTNPVPNTPQPVTSSAAISSQQPYFTIRVKPMQQFLTNKQGRQLPLHSGMTLSADIVTRQKPLFQFFTEPFWQNLDRAFRDPSAR